MFIMSASKLALCSVTIPGTVSNIVSLSPSSLTPSSLSTRGAIYLLAFLVLSLATASRGVSLPGSDEVVEPVPQQDSLKTSALLASSTALASRVKRNTRDVQQLCGYRLLDALRNVCDRNFPGFTRRSDPTMFMQSAEVHSGEEFGSISPFPGAFSNVNLSPWEVLALEIPSTSSSGTQVGGDGRILSFPNSNNLDTPMLDYLELLQQQVPSSPQAWPSTSGRNAGYGAGGANGSKAFAMKLLAEPPKTHQRFRRSISDECCKKPCAMNQLLKYCAIGGVGKRSF